MVISVDIDCKDGSRHNGDKYSKHGHSPAPVGIRGVAVLKW
jgi:hypothetical protein